MKTSDGVCVWKYDVLKQLWHFQPGADVCLFTCLSGSLFIYKQNKSIHTWGCKAAVTFLVAYVLLFVCLLVCLFPRLFVSPFFVNRNEVWSFQVAVTFPVRPGVLGGPLFTSVPPCTTIARHPTNSSKLFQRTSTASKKATGTASESEMILFYRVHILKERDL